MTEQVNDVLKCTTLAKSFDEGPQELQVLKDVNLLVSPSERIAIVGASGSGKTTLLQLLAGLDQPTSGEVLVCGHNLANMKDREQNRLRNQHLGFVYQFHHLLPEFTALENVSMPLLLRKGESLAAIRQQAGQMLELVGMSHRMKHKPAELSGGERQRVAIARALVTQPDLVFMDEPTGNLDPNTASRVHELMTRLSNELTTSFIVVTHDMAFAEQMDRTYLLQGGCLLQS
ncbi:lipoprotein ABC transporter ATP-binding protein [Endozoicomonas montiporae]|uniref:Lipoprotein ABC transporter ATP-binding protein n=2 Tax=Endozoicomonas montiporae TaxID=1027273 RepID=A0A081NA15_9GAMM|nr:ATP-binding cassette domain-containing protein [Endozoicomonas montiporae]AMO57038.1 lipoprotein releasing system, ATP-binding protein [Endozoicomonas montiporae CL-33]KEQ15288.1 lipoprotein ABC transporter ATP-binding protein [Endozoicomonas montiporae]